MYVLYVLGSIMAQLFIYISTFKQFNNNLCLT